MPLLACAATAAIFIVPFLIFLTLSGGVGEYFRTALVYVSREAERTSFSLPRLSLDWSKPLVVLSRTPVPTTVRINVRWHPIAEEARRDGESQFSLAAGEPLDSTTWTYALRDTSSGNIESLVRDPRVGDTSGLDRTNFTVAEVPRPLRFGDPVRHLAECDRVSVLHVCGHALYRWIRAVQIA